MKYLLITGSYRSGTTYLYKALNNNKNIDILYQPSIKIFKYLDLEIRKFLKKKTFVNFPLGITNINKKILLDKFFLKRKTLIKIIKNLLKKKNSNSRYYHKLLNYFKVQDEIICAKTFIKILFDSVKKKQSKAIIGFKEPFVGSLLKLLVENKKLYIINIIRDPREIYFSRNYSLFKNHRDFKNKKHPVILTSLICNRNMETDRILKNKKNYLSINFNDLIYKPNLIEKKIKNFLNVNIKIKRNIPNWKVNSSGLTQNYGSNWKNNIPLKELAIIENICSANFKYYKLKRFLTNKVFVNKIIKSFYENEKNILSWTKNSIFLKYSKTKLKNIL